MDWGVVFKTPGVQFDGIWNQHWNTEMVIVSQMAILKLVYLVFNTRNICDHINSHLDLCNKGTNDELVHDSYGVGSIFRNKCRNQTQVQRHCTFSNLIMSGKLRKDF